MTIRTVSPWVYFESFELQYSYSVFQEHIIDRIKIRKDDLENYKRKTKDHPRMVKEQNLEQLSHQNPIFIKNAKELWNWARNATEGVKPILVYYSWQQFSAFFIYSLFKWANPSQGHGIKCKFSPEQPDDINDITLEFSSKGFFKRLIDTFVLLGKPTAYNHWLPFVDEKGIHLSFKKNTLQVPSKIKLSGVLEFDSRDFNHQFKLKYPTKFYDANIDTLLTDFIILFVASNIARYRPSKWNEILIGKTAVDAEFYTRIKKAYRNFDELDHCFLDQVLYIFKTWENK